MRDMSEIVFLYDSICLIKRMALDFDLAFSTYNRHVHVKGLLPLERGDQSFRLVFDDVSEVISTCFEGHCVHRWNLSVVGREE